MPLSSFSSFGAVRGGYRATAIPSNITHLSIIRFYLKLFVYLLIVVFALLQYINWENSTIIKVHYDTNTNSMKNTILKQSQQRQQQQRQQQDQILIEQQNHHQEPLDITTKIHIVFSTGCNAFQDCK